MPELRVALHPAHGRWLDELADLSELVWATTWQHEANRVLSPLLGLPQDLPVLPLRMDPLFHGRYAWKTDQIADWVGPRPFVWIDDAINRRTRDRLGTVGWLGPHLALRIDPALGLRRADVERVSGWLQERCLQKGTPESHPPVSFSWTG
ncbi:MAG TPA: hypothetical protein P5181_12725 [Dermatophilaceae bacterium]|nr:hypothetical protein [Dermatophilaceae bacterium]